MPTPSPRVEADTAPESHAGVVRRAVRRWHDGACAQAADSIAEEVPVAFICNDRPHVVMMATPCDLDDFALGFALAEAIIADASELLQVEARPLLEGIELRLTLPAARADALETRRRNLVGRTGCGLCGTQVLEDALRQPPPVSGGPCIAAAVLPRSLARLQQAQPLNAATGATHAAAWVDADGQVVLLREDVGRHNALDKLIGAHSRAGLDPRNGFVLVTSRASSEMVQKAATAGFTLLAAISAPTALAIQLATQAGLTLAGFVRGDSHVVYAHPWRIGEAEEARA